MDCNNNCWPSGHWTVKEQLLGVQPLESLLQHTLWSCQLSGKDNCTASSHQSITAQSFLSESKADGYNKASEHETSVMIVRFFYLSLKSRSFLIRWLEFYRHCTLVYRGCCQGRNICISCLWWISSCIIFDTICKILNLDRSYDLWISPSIFFSKPGIYFWY